ncbi:MAG: enoyl-CoA hydratase-related protein [Acidimicrobiales bacterium]
MGRTLIVTIDRPERRNAIDQPTATALFETFTAFSEDPALDVAILTGAGGTFCAGADLRGHRHTRRDRLDEDMAAPGPLGCSRMELDKPVIAAAEGHVSACSRSGPARPSLSPPDSPRVQDDTAKESEHDRDLQATSARDASVRR